MREIVAVLSLIQWVHSEKKNTLNFQLNWNLFYTLVVKHRIWHTIYNALMELNIESPVMQKLNERCETDKVHILKITAETLSLSNAFNKNSIQHCFIKGCVLNEMLYGSLLTRTCRDIDVWIDEEYFQRAVDEVMALGYQIKLPIYVLSGYKKQYYLTHKHDITFVHPQKKIILEVHFRLSYFGIDFFTQNKVAFKTIMLCNMPVQSLEDNYHLLYLMIHGAIHAWVRMRWLLDILLYLKSGRCSLVQVMALAEKIHCRHIVEQSLILVRDLFAFENSSMNSLLKNPCKRAVYLAKVAKQFISSEYEFSGNFGVFKKEFFLYRLYLMRLAVSGQKFKAIGGDLFKIDNLFPFVTFPYRLRFLYYLLYPIWVIRYLVLGK